MSRETTIMLNGDSHLSVLSITITPFSSLFLKLVDVSGSQDWIFHYVCEKYLIRKPLGFLHMVPQAKWIFLHNGFQEKLSDFAPAFDRIQISEFIQEKF